MSYPAADRLGTLILGEGHHWVASEEGDCWRGEHAPIYCGRCYASLGVWCYFDLPYDGAKEGQQEVTDDARLPCPGEDD